MLENPKPTVKETPSVATSAESGVVRHARQLVTPRVLTFIVALAAIIGAGIVAWAVFLRPIEVEVATVERDVPVQVFGLGTVEARVASKVGFKVSGVVDDLRADVGDRIARGAILTRLDDREQRALVTRAQAAVEQAEANRERAKASVEKAQVNFGNAKSINERRHALLKSSSISIETAETAKATQDAALADLALAKSDVQVAMANISEAKAELEQQSTILDYYTLRAPYDAMVTARLKELGSAIGAGEPVFALINPETVWVLAYIDESKAGKIQVGEPVKIVLRSRPGQRFQGRVARIEPESDRVNEERKVEVAFDQIPAFANLGEQAEVYITTVRLPQVLLVPESAVINLVKDRGTVWIVVDERLQRREVTLGDQLLDGRYEITTSLPAGAQVVTRLPNGLRVGRAATIVSEPKPSEPKP
jgi:HlyD family secretion protein